MTEPVKTFSVYDYLRDPSIVLGQHRPVEGSESGYIEMDPQTRESRVVETQTFEDLLDSWDQELPRDPDLYGAGDTAARKPRRKASGAQDKSPQPEADASPAAASAAGKQAADAKSANQATSDEEE